MHNRLSYLLLGLWATIAVACGSIYDQGQCVDSSHKITFSISVADNTTRNSWAEQYSGTIGTSFDNMIGLDDLRVVIYNAADNTLVGEVQSLIHWQTAEGRYQFVGDMSHLSLAAEQYKIRPPSKSETGKRLRSARATETLAKKERAPLSKSRPPQIIAAIADKTLKRGPKKLISASFPYEMLSSVSRSLASNVIRRNPPNRTRQRMAPSRCPAS